MVQAGLVVLEQISELYKYVMNLGAQVEAISYFLEEKEIASSYDISCKAHKLEGKDKDGSWFDIWFDKDDMRTFTLAHKKAMREYLQKAGMLNKNGTWKES